MAPSRARRSRTSRRGEVGKLWTLLFLFLALAGPLLIALAATAVIWLVIFGILMPLGALFS